MDNGASAEPTGFAGAEAPEPDTRLGPTDGIPSAGAGINLPRLLMGAALGYFVIGPALLVLIWLAL